MSWIDWILDALWPKPKPQPKPQPEPPPIPDDVQRLLDAHNKYRASKGLAPLTLNEKLGKAAQNHAEWMVDHGLRHTGFPRRLTEAGYQYSNCGENIAWNYKTPESCTQGWIDSAGHRKNILGNFTEVGFGHAGVYWAADYAKPKTSSQAVPHVVACVRDLNSSSVSVAE